MASYEPWILVHVIYERCISNSIICELPTGVQSLHVVKVSQSDYHPEYGCYHWQALTGYPAQKYQVGVGPGVPYQEGEGKRSTLLVPVPPLQLPDSSTSTIHHLHLEL